MKATLRIAAVACAALFVLSACGSGDDSVAASSDALKGLDTAIVSEVLANPVALERINGETGSRKSGMAQGIVRNFIVCRSAFDVYNDWRLTGTPSDLVTNPEPANPVEPSNKDFADYYQRIAGAVTSGDILIFREWLTGEGSCGQWIPSEPGDPNSPTIRDAIETSG